LKAGLELVLISGIVTQCSLLLEIDREHLSGMPAKNANCCGAPSSIRGSSGEVADVGADPGKNCGKTAK